MKIIITASITLDTNKRETLLNAAQPLITEVRKQPGCIRYNWSADSGNINLVNVFEEWEDESTLKAHFSGRNYSRMGALLGEIGINGATATKFRIEKEGPIFDESGEPTSKFT